MNTEILLKVLKERHDRYNGDGPCDDDTFNRELAVVLALEAVIDAVKAATAEGRRENID